MSSIRHLPLLLAGWSSVFACTDWEALDPVLPVPGFAASMVARGERLARCTGDSLVVARARPDGALETVAFAAEPTSGLAFAGESLLAWSGPVLRVYAPPLDGELQPLATVEFDEDDSVLSATIVGPSLFACTARPSLNPWVPDYRTLAVDLADPAQPAMLGQIGSLCLLDELDGWLMTGGDGLHLLDVSDPLEPVEVAHAGTGWVNGMARDGSRVGLVLDDGWGLEVLDLVDPGAPRVLDTVGLEWGGDWDVFNHFQLSWFNDELLLANKNGGFLGFQLTEAERIEACGPLPSDPLPGSAEDVAVAGGRLWMADWSPQLASLPLFGDPPAPTLTVAGGAARLDWDPGAAGQWTVRRCADPAFPVESAEVLGTTSEPFWIDGGAQAAGRAFYRVTAGRP